MDQKWKVKLYKSPIGERPVEDFIDSLEKKTQLKIYHALELM